MGRLPNYDITIEYGSITPIGIMLASDNGRKLWRSYYAPTFSQQQFVRADYASFPPDQELVWACDDWSNGCGQWLYNDKEPGFYFESRNVDCRFEGQVILSPLMTTTALSAGAIALGNPYMCKSLGHLLLGVGRYLFKYDYTNENWGTAIFDAGAGNTIRDIKTFNSKTYVALGDSVKFNASSDNITFTPGPGADDYAYKFEVVQSQIWKMKTTGDLKSSVDGTTWSSSYQIGETGDTARNLLCIEKMLMILKDSGGYTIDNEGEAWDIFSSPALGQQTQYHAVKEWHNFGFLSTSDEGLDCYYKGQKQWIHPKLFGPNNSDLLGYAHCMEGIENWFFLGLYGSPVLAGRWKVMPDGNTDFVWHPIWFDATINAYTVTEKIVRALLVDVKPNGNTRLWVTFASKAAASDYRPGYLTLPGSSDNPRYDSYSQARYCASGTFVTGYWDAGFKDINKAFLYLTINSESLTGTSRTIKVEYQVDGGSTWLEWGGVGNGTFNTSPSQTKYSYAGASALTGKRIRFQFTLATDANTATPVMTSFILHAILRPTLKKIFDFTGLAVGGRMLSDGKTRSEALSSKQITDLITAQQQVWPVTLWDRRGTSWTVNILSPSPEESEIVDNKGNIESVVRIVAIEAKTA